MTLTDAIRDLFSVSPRLVRLDPRLAPHYAKDKARARERAEGFVEADEMEDDDAGLTLVYYPCYCQGGPLCSC